MRGTQINDRRIAKFLTQVNRFSSGDYSHSLDISEKPDEIDAVSRRLSQRRHSLHVRATESGKLLSMILIAKKRLTDVANCNKNRWHRTTRKKK